MKTRGFTEFTYTDGENEVMVHHDIKTDKVVALYTYAKDAPAFNQMDDRRGNPIHPFTWHPGLNPLFVHLRGTAIQRFVREFIDCGELVGTEREN